MVMYRVVAAASENAGLLVTRREHGDSVVLPRHFQHGQSCRFCRQCGSGAG